MKPARVLYQTISDWGVGDELALRGSIALMEEQLPGHLKFFADSSPDLQHVPCKERTSDIWGTRWPSIEFDLVVHSGGNCWTGAGHDDLEAAVAQRGWPVIYLGVGMANHPVNEAVLRDSMKHVRLFIGRDEIARGHAARLGAKNAHCICCPSFFLDAETKANGPVGLVFQGLGEIPSHSCYNPDIFAGEVGLFRRVSAAKPTRIICHFIGDYAEAMKQFPEYADRIVYSRVIDDYIRWYSECSKIMSMRFHGAYLGAALGLPTVCLKAKMLKCEALKHIAIPVVHPDAVRSDDLGGFSNPAETEKLKAQYGAEVRQLLKEAVA